MRRLTVVALVVGALVAGWLWLDREPDAAALFERANPGWTVVAVHGRPARADDASGQGELLLSHEDLGPSRIRRVDCDEVRKVWPRWFALPDVPLGRCARLDGDDGTRWVQGVTTPMPVTQLWDRHFGPLLDRLRLGYSGGRAGRFPEGVETDVPAGQTPPEEKGAGFYLVDAPVDSDERPVAIAFWRLAGTTEVVFTFRPPARPSPPPAPSRASAP